MKQILVFCVLAFLCGTSAETLDSRGLAVDDSLLLQNVWGNEEDKQARGEDNGWVIIPRGALPDLTDCTFPDIEPNPDIDNFNLTGTPYITFDGCGVYVTQNWEGTKIVGSEEQIAEGKTTYKIGRPQLITVPHCADPVVEGTKLPFASVAPEDLFEFKFESNCWSANSVLSSFKPYHAGFQYGNVKFNLCPQLATSNVTATNCLQMGDIFATQYGIGIYDSDTDVFSIRRGRATFDGKLWYAEYRAEFAYQWDCPEADDEILFTMGSIVSSFSRVNDISHTMNGTQVICKVV